MHKKNDAVKYPPGGSDVDMKPSSKGSKAAAAANNGRGLNIRSVVILLAAALAIWGFVTFISHSSNSTPLDAMLQDELKDLVRAREAEIEAIKQLSSDRKREDNEFRVVIAERAKKNAEWAALEAERARKTMEWEQLKLEQSLNPMKPLPGAPTVGKAPEEENWREEVGRSTWRFLHSMAARYPEYPTEDFRNSVANQIRALQHLYPCEICRNNLNRYLNDKSSGLWPPALNSRTDLSMWLCKLHNVVNGHLYKTAFPCDMRALDDRWLKNCDECVAGSPQELEALLDRDLAPMPELNLGGIKAHSEAGAAKLPAIPTQQAAQQGKDDVKAKLLQPLAAPGTALGPVVTGGTCSLNLEKWISGEANIGDGRVNLLLFWSPSCQICKTYLPTTIQDAHNRYAKKGLNIIAITDSTPQTEPQIRKFIEDNKITYPVAAAPMDRAEFPYGKFLGAYKGIPALIEINSQCQISRQWWGYKIDNLMADMKTALRF